MDFVPARAAAATIALLVLLASRLVAAQTIVVDTVADRADPPFDADDICGVGTIFDLPGADQMVSLREAIIAANNTPGPQSIRFAAALAGQTITVDFDDLDADTAADQLPFLCGNDTSINGDIDGDGVPDITISGGAGLLADADGLVIVSSHNTVQGLRVQGFPQTGIVVIHVAALNPLPSLTDNIIAHNIVTGGTSPIILIAGSAEDPTESGTIADTSISDNTVSGAVFGGIAVQTGDAPGSSIANTTVARNHTSENQFGIIVETGFTAASAGSTISDTWLTDNEAFGNTALGILISSLGRNNATTRVRVERNQVHDNEQAGIAVSGGFDRASGNSLTDLVIAGNQVNEGMMGLTLASGVCGSTQNMVTATVANNTFGGSGMFVGAGINSGCEGAPLPPAADNQLMITVTGNDLRANAGFFGIGAIGGAIGAERNTTIARISDNSVAGIVGIAAIAGLGTFGGENLPADDNTLSATLAGNRIANAGLGIFLSAGGPGTANRNTADLIVDGNLSCGASIDGIQCTGGFPGFPGFPANGGTGNRAMGTITNNSTTTVTLRDGIAGNTCATTAEQNTSCLDPDASCDRRVSAPDLTAVVAADTTGEPSGCGLGVSLPDTTVAIFTPQDATPVTPIVSALRGITRGRPFEPRSLRRR